jgi:hypothetical protein
MIGAQSGVGGPLVSERIDRAISTRYFYAVRMSHVRCYHRNAVTLRCGWWGKIMKNRAKLIVVAWALANVSPAGANLVSNGGFEEGVFGDGSVRVISPGDSTLPGWTVRDNPVA